MYKTELELNLAGRPLRYVLVRMRRRRHIQLQIMEDGQLAVRVPWTCPRHIAEKIVQHNREWVVSSLEAAQRHRPPPLATGRALGYLDEILNLRLSSAKRSRVERDGSWLHVAGPSQDEVDVRAQLEAWYRRQARTDLSRRIDRFATRLGISRPRLVIRDPRTRWGSCSSKGIVNLSWRLMLLPRPLGDYVVAHELAHLLRMDHSPEFWNEVERVVPDWRERRQALGAVSRDQVRF